MSNLITSSLLLPYLSLSARLSIAGAALLGEDTGKLITEGGSIPPCEVPPAVLSAAGPAVGAPSDSLPGTERFESSFVSWFGGTVVVVVVTMVVALLATSGSLPLSL